MKSYLTNRYQYVEIEDVKSSTLPLTTGVPQGSVLGPLLFLIYINDISMASNLFKFVIYADDTNMNTNLEIISERCIDGDIASTINRELACVSDWLKCNMLSLNVQKSKYMIFHKPQKKIPNIQLVMNDVNIEQVTHFDFLGLTLNENLNWKNHIDKISNKISRSIGILNKHKHFIPLQSRLHIVT